MMADADLVDWKYYGAAPPRSLAERLMIIARDRIYEDFLIHCRPEPDDTILDVGVSDVINDSANMLERKYPRQNRLTALGLGDGRAFSAAFPLARYVRIEAGQTLPFAADSFAIATSNAVLEHVGSRDNQRRFVDELLRVARKVFISVPNRYFPVEHHTAIPVLHYWDRTFALACAALGKDEWTQERNLIPMSTGRLRELRPAGVGSTIGHTGIALGPLSSNLFLFADRTGRSR